jgi:5-methylthioadenosine/S-adenosylhomocysteine deaminase
MKIKEQRKGGERITIYGEILFQGEDITETQPFERVKKGLVLSRERHPIFPESDVVENLKIAGHDVKVSHNPESNMKLASGVSPVADLIDRGVCAGLGTDGCSSNNNLDLFAEMDMAAKLHKANCLDPTVMDAATVLRMATIDGARALGLDAITGSLEIGKKADIIVVDTRKPHLTPMYHPASHLVYAVGGSDVSATIINGRVLMKDRQLVAMDVEEVMGEAHEIAAEIRDL